MANEIVPPGPTRGAIRTEISTSTDLLVAGQPFSLFVTVYNPFEVPLTLHRISTYLPTEFADVESGKSRHDSIHWLTAIFGPMGTGTDTGDDREVIARRADRGTGDGRAVTPRDTGPVEARASGTTEAAALPQAQAKIVELSQAVKPSTPEAAVAQAQTKMVELSKGTQEAPYPITLQPGNSTTCIFTLRTRRKMWFTPSTYKLSFDVIYGIKDGPKNSDTIQRILQVRASLVAIAVGAAAGALVGWLVRRVEAGEGLAWGWTAFSRFFVNLFSLFATLLLATMSVLFLARKKDTQPVVSVEDIWGGVVVGFLVAYSGQDFVGPPSGQNSILRTG